MQAVLDALDARAAQRARRPMMVLGAVGPAVLLVVAPFAMGRFRNGVGRIERGTHAPALESDRFAAQFVAETVGTELDRRWKLAGTNCRSGRISRGDRRRSASRSRGDRPNDKMQA